MACDTSDEQARIDKLFASPLTPLPADVRQRLLRSAMRGADDPASLSAKETRDICRALVVHYAELGLS